MQATLRCCSMVGILLLATPGLAVAYIGPGVGLTAIGAGLAFIAAIVLAIIGFIWYPIKRLWRAQVARRAKARETPAETLES